MPVTGLGNFPQYTPLVRDVKDFYVLIDPTNRSASGEMAAAVKDFFFESAASVTTRHRSTMQSLENGFISMRHNCFQPSEDGAIS